MAHIGHTAASMNIFLDIPIFLRGVSQSLYSKSGPEMNVTPQFFDDILRVDPIDPTGIYKEYYGDWWNFEKEWETHSVEVNQVDAFSWHLQKVKKNYIQSNRSPVVLTLFPICSMGTFGQIN